MPSEPLCRLLYVPATLFPPWVRYVRYLLELADYWQGQSVTSDTDIEALTIESLVARKATLVWTRTEPAGVSDDVAVSNLHFINVDPNGGNLMPEWTGTHYDLVESRLTTWWTSQKTKHAPHWILSEVRWHRFGVDMPKGITGAYKYGPIERVHTFGTAGTYAGTSFLPDQCSIDATFVTASRRHWGRMYLPSPGGSLSAEGRFNQAVVDDTATNLRTLINGCYTDGQAAVVWSPKYGGAFSIATLKVDDVPDVIRRRRPKRKVYEKAFTS